MNSNYIIEKKSPNLEVKATFRFGSTDWRLVSCYLQCASCHEQLFKKYFIDFYKSQETKVQEKIGYVLDLVRFERHGPGNYGEKGTPSREKYDVDSLSFRLGVMLKEARNEAKITQDELAKKTGTKKSYISRIERGQSDIQIISL
ncbi:MAG: helix-turn-helix domain-containing protein [Prolixibacteraceae bacterium]|nr:helix-turn-helix domain-containing protein [Prolixibacteraceae bacterium]